MATTAREGTTTSNNGNNNKEMKKATTLPSTHQRHSSPALHIKKTTTRTSSRLSPSSETTPPSSSSPDKLVHGHLRPTSRLTPLEPTKGKRSSLDNSTSITQQAKPRRRSFDKPPSPLLNKAAHHASPSAVRDNKPILSKSLSTPKISNSSPRPNVSQRSLSSKNLKPEPSRNNASSSTRRATSNPGPLRKTGSNLKPNNEKTTPAAATKKKAPKRTASESSAADLKMREKDPLDHSMMGEDDIAQEVQSLPDLSEMTEKEMSLGDPFMVAHDIKNDVDLQEQQLHNALTEDDQHVADQEAAEHHQQEKINLEVEGKDKGKGDNVREEQTDENDLEEEAEKGIMESDNLEKGKEEVGEMEEDQKKDNFPKGQDKDGSVAEGEENEREEVKEEEEEEEEAAEGETKEREAKAEESPNASAGKGGEGGGKKEGQVYNDVIEETASKLMGNARRNKVLALAGAFQTVINLEKKN